MRRWSSSSSAALRRAGPSWKRCWLMLRTSTRHWDCPTGWSTSCQVRWALGFAMWLTLGFRVCVKCKEQGECTMHWGCHTGWSIFRQVCWWLWVLVSGGLGTRAALQGGQHRVECCFRVIHHHTIDTNILSWALPPHLTPPPTPPCFPFAPYPCRRSEQCCCQQVCP